MGVGPGSSKSAIGIGLCRLLADDGVDVCPFKAISIVDEDVALRHDHALVLQVAAARKEFVADMSPIVVRRVNEHEGDLYVLGVRMGSVPLVNEDMVATHLLPSGTLDAIRRAIAGAIATLRARHEYLVVEGAASPFDIPQASEVANLFAARVSGYPIMVCCSAPRSGVIGSAIGTVHALPPDLRGRLAALVVNDIHDEHVSAHVERELCAHVEHVPVYSLPHQPRFWSREGGHPADQIGYDAFAAGLREKLSGSALIG